MKTLTALALLCGLTAMAAEPAVIGSFGEGSNGWALSLGKEFPGAQGNFAAIPGDGENGAAAAWIEGAFGAGGYYTAIVKQLKPALPFKALRVKLKTSDFRALTIRLQDSSGQCHQQTLKLQATAGWQTVTVSKQDGGDQDIHWGGPSDGQWRGPLRSVSLILSKEGLKDEMTVGSVLVEKVDVLTE